jgi:hypothetical protein
MVGLAVGALILTGTGIGAAAFVSNQNSQIAQLRSDTTADRVGAVKAKSEAAKAAAAATLKATQAAAAAKVKADVAALASAVKDAAEAKAMARRPRPSKTVYVRPGPAAPTYPDYSGYSSSSYGTFPLTAIAYPGPIHSYVSPSDTSAFVRTIPSDSWVSVICSVRGQNLQGHNRWDWDGSGWIWDRMVDMGGGSPPLCSGD